MLEWLRLESLGLSSAQVNELSVIFVRVPLILIGAWVISRAARRAIRLLIQRVNQRSDDSEAIKRAETLGQVSRYVISVLLTLVAVMLVLSEFGFSLAPFLGAAGVAGLAVGFGAQSLVKDYFTGFFLLLENQIRQGDVVKLGEHVGVIEEVTLRFVRLRDYEGSVHFIPNGTISVVTNMSLGFAQAVIEIGVAYHSDLEQVMAVMQRVSQELRQDAKWADRVWADLEMAGVERFDASSIALRARIKVKPQSQWEVRREYQKRLKVAFAEAGIEIPFPQMTLHQAKSA
jgi:small conductance mechanosensitive channel